MATISSHPQSFEKQKPISLGLLYFVVSAFKYTDN